MCIQMERSSTLTFLEDHQILSEAFFLVIFHWNRQRKNKKKWNTYLETWTLTNQEILTK